MVEYLCFPLPLSDFYYSPYHPLLRIHLTFCTYPSSIACSSPFTTNLSRVSTFSTSYPHHSLLPLSYYPSAFSTIPQHSLYYPSAISTTPQQSLLSLSIVYTITLHILYPSALSILPYHILYYSYISAFSTIPQHFLLPLSNLYNPSAFSTIPQHFLLPPAAISTIPLSSIYYLKHSLHLNVLY